MRSWPGLHLLGKSSNAEAKGRGGHRQLQLAAWNGLKKGFKLLLEKGFNIKAKDEFGRTVLHEAAEDGQEEVVKLLLEKGVDIEAKDRSKGTAPLCRPEMSIGK
jgi:ankyrin repeat protein